jgi:hypothetical protein
VIGALATQLQPRATQAAAIYVEVGDRHCEAIALNNLGNALQQMSRSGRLGRLWRAALGRVGVYRKRSSAIDPPPHPTARTITAGRRPTKSHPEINLTQHPADDGFR